MFRADASQLTELVINCKHIYAFLKLLDSLPLTFEHQIRVNSDQKKSKVFYNFSIRWQRASLGLDRETAFLINFLFFFIFFFSFSAFDLKKKNVAMLSEFL